MVDHGLLSSELADLAEALRGDSDLYEGLHRLSVTAAAGLEVDGAGITLQIPSSTTGYVTAADHVTLHVERRQDELQEGACIDALKRGEIVAVSDVAAERPWSAFSDVLLDAGFHAAAGVPIAFQGLNIGAVNLYATSTRAWTTEEFKAGRLIAEMAAGYLINNELLRTARTLAQQLQHALESRIIIEQSKGVMSGRYGMTPDAAFEILRSYARTHRRKLRDVAQEVVSGDVDLLRTLRAHESGGRS